MKHVTRIAPSPTGMFHLGTARTALFNYLTAKASGGSFILRIDDTDISRNSQAAVDVILHSMEWLGLPYDTIFYQSERFDFYRSMANLLLNEGLAVKDGDAIRFNPQNIPNFWVDEITGAINITDQDRASVNGLVLIRSDGYPTYHFASVVDDMDYGVTWIIRGQDHVSNTIKHVALWNTMRFIFPFAKPPLWSHVGLIMNQKKKLSKRDGAASVLSYRDSGIDPDALVNWMLRLGWGPTNEDRSHRVIDRQRAIELFLTGGHMRAAPSNMDLGLLDFLDRKYKAAKKVTLA